VLVRFPRYRGITRSLYSGGALSRPGNLMDPSHDDGDEPREEETVLTTIQQVVKLAGVLSSYVDEVDARCHFGGQSGVQSPNLGVDICKESEARPSVDLHDEGIIDSL
jgi:hypothetical protein